jgi:hypothetical protein
MNAKCTPEYNQKTRDMQAELEKLKAQAHEVTKNIARERVLNKQSDAYREKIATGDTTPFPKRNKPQYDERVNAALAERNRLRKKVDQLIEKGRKANRSLPEKIADGAIKLQRLFILSHISALQKLPVAAIVRIVSNRMEEGVGSVIKHIPGVNKIAERAPRHGAGLSFQADVVEGARGIGDALRKGMKDQLLKGGDEIDAIFGSKEMGSEEWANLSGRVHSMMKEPAKLDEFYRSFYKRSQHAKAEYMKRTGASEEEAQAHVDQPAMRYLIGEAAFKDAKEAIMQGDNAVVDAIDSGLRQLSASSTGGKLFEKLFNVMVPIKKVPANIVKETSSYAMGGIKAAVATKNAAAAAKAAGKAWHEMTPEQADYIMKNLKKQGVGAALMVAGYLAGPSILGGLEDAFEDDKKGAAEYHSKLREGNPLPSHIKVGDTDLNANFSHATPMVAMQAGAQFRAMLDKEKKPGVFEGLSDVLRIAGSYVAEEAPVFGSLAKTYKYAERDRKLSSVAGNTLAGAVVPGAVQDIAKARDYDPAKDKNPNSPLGHFLDEWGGQFSAKTRHSKSITEDVEKSIPGLREKVGGK